MSTRHITFICLCMHLCIDANTFHRYLWANYQQFGGNKKQAQQWYGLIMNEPKKSIFTNNGYLHFLYEHGNYQKIAELMPKLETTFARDPDIQLIFVLALKNIGRLKESDEKLLRLSHTFTTHQEIVFQAVEAMIRHKELQNALLLVDDYLNNSPYQPNSFIFHFLKAQIYSEMRDFKQAIVAIKQCLDFHPKFPQGWLLLAMLEEQVGQLEQAIGGYSAYLEIAGRNQQIEQHLLELVFKKKAVQHGQQTLFIGKACLTQALLLFERKQYKAALAHIEQCLAQNPHDTNTRLAKIQILMAMHETDAVIKTVIAWINQDPANPAWYQVMYLLTRAGTPIKKIIDALSTVHENHQHTVLPLIYLADLSTKANLINHALAYHQKALLCSDNQELKTRILYQLSMLYYERGEYRTMLSYLDQIEQSTISYPPAHNLHAYYYATKGKDLHKAQALIEKALNSDKNNPHFLDTQALIFYKNGDYKKAIALLTLLREKALPDSTILIHLAQTYAKLGDMKQARSIIDVAQQCVKTAHEMKKSAILAYRWNKTNSA